MSSIGGGTPIPTLKTGRAHPHPEPLSGSLFSAAELMPGDRHVVMLDQRLLPRIERYEIFSRVEQVADAISTMKVRGAPAIGIAAAYGLVLAAGFIEGSRERFLESMQTADKLLRRTRPTAVNLAWALDRMARTVARIAGEAPIQRVLALGAEARAIHSEDVAACRAMGALGAANVRDGATVLTHCNAGALATGGYGTALGVIRAARDAGKKIRVLSAETRPLLQGARLTAWELHKDGIQVETITDSMVASFMARGLIDQVIVGADRVARNGDVANKIGTYGVACLAQLHGIPFDVAAPWSTVDLACPSGADIPIEQRGEREVSHVSIGESEVQIMPDGVRAHNPSFDVTPFRLIRALYTERGTASPLTAETLARLAPSLP
ncbi:S-methyl-5-thioribose-1-phosphate isomerase [Pendulispora albinea]|uniref:Methylthioribose-1-phosphate isomerase n=1 Tax=Pendulispora albinea TaxID=2741071 RepID=A0ABZ2LP93_9BACT